MGELEAYAEAELRRAGWFDDGPDAMYGGAVGPAVMKMVKVFAEEGHTGMSGRIVLDVFNRVVRFKPLTKLTSDPEEWMEVEARGDGQRCWQSRRNPACFSRDGGKTYYDINEDVPADGERTIHTSEEPSTSTRWGSREEPKK